MTYSNEYYARLQEELTDLLAELEAVIDTQAASWTREYIEVNELGLALETMTGALEELKVVVSEPVASKIRHLSQTMGLDRL